MGTLFKQEPRRSHDIDIEYIDHFLGQAVKLAKKHKISVGDVMKAYKVAEAKRANDLYMANGDAFDEQIAGIGELIRSIDSNIGCLTTEYCT